MADFYRTNGNTGPAGSAIMFYGKALKFFHVVVADGSNTKQDLRTELGVNLAVPAILNALESNASVLGYQVENTANGNISVILEGAADFTAAKVQAIIQGNSPYGNNAVNGSGSTVFDNGFKLATS
jgi:hypothetical protein